MGIFINGVNIIGNGNNVVMVNGRIVSGNVMLGNSQKFNEKRSLQIDGVNRVAIKSDSRVIVTASDTNIIEADFHGEAIVDEKPKLDIVRNGREVVVTLDIDSNSISSSDLTLNVNIPMQMFDTLSIASYNGKVVVKNHVSAKHISLQTYNGDVESDADFSEISAITYNGNVFMGVEAKNNVKIEASSHNGNVFVELRNIAISNIIMSTRNGNTRNRFRECSEGYTAYGKASTYNGNVIIK